MTATAYQFDDLFPFLLVFARITAAAMTIPGFSGKNFNSRARILFAAAMSFVMTPVLEESLPSVPNEPYLFFAYIIYESFIGVFIGTMGRMLLVSIEVAGAIIGFQSGLMNAFVLNPVQGHQSALSATFLSTIVITLFFVADIHHIALQAVYDSYSVFSPGQITSHPNITEHFLYAVLTILVEGFILAIQIAAPLMILALLYFIGMGLLNRLMPQLHVFFVGQPLQIYIGFLILSLILVGASTTILERLAHLYNSMWNL